MIENALREGLSAGCLTQSSNETEGLSDWEVSLDLDQWRAFTRVLLEHTPTPQVHAVVDTTHGLLWACDLDQEHRLLQGRLRDQLCSETTPTGGGHDLPSATVDGIGVQSDIHDVEPNASHVLLTQRSFLCGPLESTVDVLLDFDEILHALRLVNHYVSTLGLWAPTPDLPRCIFVPIELLTHELRALLHLSLGARFAVLDGLAKLVRHRLCCEIDPIVLVGRLCQASHRRCIVDGLSIRDHWVRDDELALSVLLAKILQANLHMQLTASRNHVLTALLGRAHHQRVGLRKLLQTFDELWQLLSVLDLHCYLHHWRHTVLHVSNVVS